VPKYKFLRNEPGLDRLAEPHVVRDQQVHARTPYRPGHRLQLIVLDLDAGPERRLERLDIRAGNRTPPNCVEERLESARIVGLAARHEDGQGCDLQNLTSGLHLPDDVKLRPEAVVLDVAQPEKGVPGTALRNKHVRWQRRRGDVRDDPVLASDADHLPDLGQRPSGRRRSNGHATTLGMQGQMVTCALSRRNP